MTTTTSTTTTTTTTPVPLPKLQNATNCGVKGDSNRVIGGSAATENQYPWICSILRSDFTFYGCAATLLSCFPQVIIVSAAHCFARRTAEEISELWVVCGDHRTIGFNNIDSNEWRVQIQSVTIHPKYKGSSNSFDSDIATIRVSLLDEVQFSLVCRPKVIWPACLPARGEQYNLWKDSEVQGWGSTSSSGVVVLPPSLRFARVLPVPQLACKHAMGEDRISDGMICAFGDGTDTCQGDSGGPMTSQAKEGDGYSLVGITSWGDGCAQPGTYGVYARVGYYMDWVAQQYDYSGVG